MSFDLVSSALFAQSEEISPVMQYLIGVAKLLLAIPLPVMAGIWLAQWLRMKDYGWRLAIIFCSLSIATVFATSFPLRLGVDLKGGVILVYQIDREALSGEDGGEASSRDVDWTRLIQRLTNRINPSGTKEIVVRQYGDWEIEIIIPDVDPIEVDRIKKQISTAGSLEFRIVANASDHDRIIRLAEEQALDPVRARSKFVKDESADDEGSTVGYWARVGREPDPVAGGIFPLKVQAAGDTIRNASTGEIIQVPTSIDYSKEYAFENWLKDEGIKEIDILMETDDGFDVTGDDLGMVSKGYDEVARPCVKFNMKGRGIGLMGGLTGSNLPDKQREFYRRLGIMLDGSLLSAPRVMSTISDQGQITGQFSQAEVDFLVGILQAGSLPAALKKDPISESQIGAVLGEDTIQKGEQAIAISLGLVLLFILVWYRFAGIVACVALAANLLLIVALMKFPLRAPLTLPGLAGLVLTVGMSVDANVLIFERIREELERGAALRMAIRNGFSRATTTIVDANLTTLITALVLYVIGTDQIRGFAVTLILGILMSMFTAIFCSRVVFDIFERTRRIASLTMMRLVGATHIDFIGKRKLAIAASSVLIVVGLVATVSRGKQIFDIDFLGGTSVTMVLSQPIEETDIRAKLDEKFASLRVDGSTVQYSVNRVDVRNQTEGTVWKIDSSLQEVSQLEEILEASFPVATHDMSFTEPTETRVQLRTPPVAEVKPEAELTSEPGAEAEPEAKPATEPAADQTPDADSKPGTEPTTPKAQAAADPKPEAETDPVEQPMPETEPVTGEAKPTADEPEEAAAGDEKVEPSDASETNEPETPSPKAGDDARRQDLPDDTMLALAGDDAGWILAQADPKEDIAEETDAPEMPAEGDQDAPEPAETESDSAQADTPPATEPAETAEEPPAEKPADAKPEPDATGDAADTDSAAKPKVRILSQTKLTFDYKINGRTLEAEVINAGQAVGIQLTEDDITIAVPADNPDWTIDDSIGYKSWNISVASEQADAEKIFEQMKTKMVETPVWSSSSKIGGKVAGDTRTKAAYALFFSLLCIVIYIWVRFQRVIYGLAAVVALVHDVLITLGAIAISYWLAGFLGFLQIEEFKISLPVVAAFMTIIGYSLNDTIVVFDRIREVRGKSPDLTEGMINTSINQTLSRTLLTSLTTFLVVIILYFLGGAGIHGFAFSLVVGVIVGTYSSIFVASPFLLWMSGTTKTAQQK